MRSVVITPLSMQCCARGKLGTRLALGGLSALTSNHNTPRCGLYPLPTAINQQYTVEALALLAIAPAALAAATLVDSDDVLGQSALRVPSAQLQGDMPVLTGGAQLASVHYGLVTCSDDSSWFPVLCLWPAWHLLGCGRAVRTTSANHTNTHTRCERHIKRASPTAQCRRHAVRIMTC